MARQVRSWLMKPENVRAPIECAKAGGGQPAEPIRDSGLRAAAKVRMYGCNRYLSAASREEKPGKGWGRPCTDIRLAELFEIGSSGHSAAIHRRSRGRGWGQCRPSRRAHRLARCS